MMEVPETHRIDTGCLAQTRKLSFDTEPSIWLWPAIYSASRGLGKPISSRKIQWD